MSSQASGRARPLGETAGSAERRPRRLAATVLTVDLASEFASLKAEAAWRRSDRNARTLVKEPSFRVVLVGMKTGARLREHRAEGAASIHTMHGTLRVGLNGQIVDLPAGHLLALEAGVP